MYRRIVYSLALVALLCAIGCGGPKKPDGLPKLVPCKLTFTQGAAPLADANVYLVYQGDDPDMACWTVGGTTDAMGVADMITYGQFKGAPEGKFQVVVSKESSETADGMINGYSLVDTVYTSPATTTLEIEIDADGAEQTFDVGEPVEVLLDSHPAAAEP